MQMFATNLCIENAEPALKKREGFLDAGNLSRPQSEACLAVITSAVKNKCRASPEATASLLLESRAILDTLLDQGKAAEDVISPSAEDLDAILKDPKITDMCVIGEGALGNLYVIENPENPTYGIDYDWIRVGQAADHLKTGGMFQRMCSVVGISNVAWGTFAVADVRKVMVSEEPFFEPTKVHTDPAEGLMTIYDENHICYDGLWDLAVKLDARP